MRDVIFFSYCHEDDDWLVRFETMLAPALGGRTVAKWSDHDIVPGAKWREAIASALEATTVAVLLVSPNFLKSTFVQNQELPKLLEGAADQELTILWVYLRPCMYKLTPIADYQAAHDVSKPLSLLTPRRREQVVLEVCEHIVAAYQANGKLGPDLFPSATAGAVMPESESLRPS